MDDRNEATAKAYHWSEPDHPPVDTESNPQPDSHVPLDEAKAKQESTGEKAVDRWFLEQRGNKRVPKRLEIANEALITSGGPIKMSGNITLIQEDGSVTHANQLSLCRCGGSKTKPVCDGQHLDIEFLDTGAVSRPSDWMPVSRPQTITVTCVKNGPLKFRGYLRVFNNKGQECITMNGALCRCGKSSKKPFCDSAHGCAGC
jgi:CDGSH-type Zn-finger protein